MFVYVKLFLLTFEENLQNAKMSWKPANKLNVISESHMASNCVVSLNLTSNRWMEGSDKQQKWKMETKQNKREETDQKKKLYQNCCYSARMLKSLNKPNMTFQALTRTVTMLLTWNRSIEYQNLYNHEK